MRVFIAVEVHENIRARLAQISENIQRSGLIYGTFVSKEDIHLTLKFLGDDISEEDIEKMKKRLSELNFKPFSMKVKGIGFFPSEEYVKVIWAGIKSDELNELEKIISSALADLGFKMDDFDFHGHLTIVRVKGVKNKDLFKEKISQINFKASEFDVDAVHLFKSELTRRGPIYKKLASFNFS